METRPGRTRWRPGCPTLPAAVRLRFGHNGRRWPAASRHRGFRRFCRASGGVSGRAWPSASPQRSRHARRRAGWPTPPRGGPGRRRAGRGRRLRSAATWTEQVPLLGRPFDPVLRPVWPPVRSALRLALRALRNRRILPEIPRVLGGSIPPGSIRFRWVHARSRHREVVRLLARVDIRAARQPSDGLGVSQAWL